MSLRVLGLDPGTATFGWGVVESGGEQLLHRAHGVILTEPSLALGDRLAVIRDALVAIIREQRPDRIAIERIFSQGNVQSAVGIGAARGVTLLVAADLALPLIEATPSEMKRAVAGDGRASKAAVTLAVTRLLGLSAAPTPNDAADALGLAIWGGGAARLERSAGSSRADRSSAQGIAAESGFDRAVRAALRAERR
jgi:crossover junction endodeoxyribonuclease RuvC